MIRFIDLGEQILEGQKSFAWFDTITDTFIEYDGYQTWDSWEDFAYSYHQEKVYSKFRPLERFKKLFKA